ncbi:hypothetical protein V6N11_018160 [Hibiscus sabdariffa]|uniref:Uncharacterized protein n=1 Tax=Hibiscus sabdariffa TaxID=183260 RepID=A0ABR2T6K3_9ROSI
MSSMGEDPIWDQFRQDVLLLFERYLGTLPQSDFSKNETAQERGNEQNQILLVTFNAMTEVQVFDKMSNDEIMTVIKKDSIENLETKTSIVPNKNYKEPIEVGVSLCVAEDLNEESPASFMASFVTQPSGQNLQQILWDIGVDTANQVENDTPTDNYKETYPHAQGEDVLFTVVMDNANNECNESVVKGKATSIASGNYNDQFQVDQLTKQSSILNFIWVVTTDPIRGNSMDTVKLHMQPEEVIDSTLHLAIIVESGRTQFICDLNPSYVGKHYREDLIRNQWVNTLNLNYGVPLHVTLKHSKVSIYQLFDKDLNVRLGDENMNLFGLKLFM